jgi:valyl-tRNA synthetase
MDAGLSRAVRETFVRLYEEGLIYQDDYIVNWCPRCQTVLSDLEVEREERDGEFVYIKYGPLTLGTVRPETKLGDTAVAVHPKDKRYAKYVGKTLEVPSVGGTITLKVIADTAVDPKFGTGVIKVTPGHDPADFEIGRRHGLPIRTVIGFDGRMTAEAGKYAGLDRFEARKRIVEDMQQLGLIERIEPYRHAVGLCYRCKTPVEPLISRQWYVNVQPLAEVALKAVRTRRIKLHPRPWIKTYYHWMENIRPWTISRQLWWGHRIPAWYCDADGSVHVSRTDLTECPKCGGHLRQDPDVLDTWFSSGLWPFSTLGWPERTPDLDTFYPTNVLITGPDILFFWVVVVMEKFGTDAFRFTLAALAGLGRDIRISEERIEGYRNFANKLWNAARLVLTNLEGYDPALARKGTPSVADRWIKSRLAVTIVGVRKALDTFRFNDAAMAVYQFLWSEFCDWYLEIAKRSLYQTEDPVARAVTQRTLVETLETTLRLLHPFMPFISEEVWQRLPHGKDAAAMGDRSIMVAPFPKAGRKGRDLAAEQAMAPVIGVVSAIRTARSESRVSPAAEVEVTVRPSSETAQALEAARSLIAALARARVTVSAQATRPPQSAHVVASGIDVYVHLEGVVDLGAERARLGREIERARKEIAFLEGKLSRPDFVERAPGDVVARERGRLEEQQQILAKLSASLTALQ